MILSVAFVFCNIFLAMAVPHGPGSNHGHHRAGGNSEYRYHGPFVNGPFTRGLIVWHGPDGPRIRKVILGTSNSNQGTWTGLPGDAIGSPTRNSPFPGHLYASGDSRLPFIGSQAGTGVGHIHGSGGSSLPFSGSQAGTGVGHIHGSGGSSLPFSGSQAGTGVGHVHGSGGSSFPFSGSQAGTGVGHIHGSGGSSFPFGSSSQTGLPFVGGSQTGTGVGHLHGSGTGGLPFVGGSQTGTGVGHLHGSGTGGLPFSDNSHTSETNHASEDDHISDKGIASFDHNEVKAGSDNSGGGSLLGRTHDDAEDGEAIALKVDLKNVGLPKVKAA